MAGRFLGLLSLRRKKKKDPGVQQPEDLEQFQPPQEDAAMDRAQQQDPAHGHFRRTAQRFQRFLPFQSRKTSTTATEGIAEPNSGPTNFQAEPDVSTNLTVRSENFDNAMDDQRAKAVLMAMTEGMSITNADTTMTQGLVNTAIMPTPTVIHAPTMDFFEENAVSPQQQVPAIVKNIHQRLASHVTVDARLQIDIVRLAEEHPADIVLTLLHCAPTCDRAAAMIWRAIGSSVPTAQKVLPTLLTVMEDWPLHRMFTSDGDNKDVFALAATLVLWVIVQVPECHEAMILYSSRLFVALLFHVVITTQQMPPEEVGNFWRACREEHRLPSDPNRFAVQAMKALLWRLRCDKEVMAMGRKHGWDTLLCADTQHYAVGLLAREMRLVLIPLCSRIAIHLLRLLSMEEPCWDLPALAFLVEVINCLDLTKCGDRVLEIMSRYLQSECRQRHHLALRGLVVLSKDPLMARRMCSLSQSLLELLGDADGDVVGMSLCVFTNMLKNKGILVSSTTAPKLAEALLVLFDNDNSHVQLLSIHLFCKVMELVVDEGKKPLKKIVNKSLYPLLIYCHDENQHVAKASRETLHCLAKFLKRRDIEQLLKKEQPLKIDECLLAEDRSRAAEHLRRALAYLESPKEPLREVAIRFIGAARVLMRRQKGALQVLNEAIQAQRQDASPSCSNLENQAQFPQRAKELGTSASSEPVSQE